MKIEGYEEISEEEYWKLPSDEGLDVGDAYTNESHYFKKAQKFPIVFEDEDRMIRLDKNGIFIENKINGDFVRLDYNKSFPLLVKAIEKAKEVMKKNETD